MTFKAPDSLAEQIAQHLGEQIIRGEMKPAERIQEQKITQLLNVSRGSVREALLILERRHLVAILPRRGAHVSELSPHKVQSLCALMCELYILLGLAFASRWKTQADLAPFLEIQQRLIAANERGDIHAFIEGSFAVMRAVFPYADNPYLQETIENLQPALMRIYYIALDQRLSEMPAFLDSFAALLQAVIKRNPAQIRLVLSAYSLRNQNLVLAALAKG